LISARKSVSILSLVAVAAVGVGAYIAVIVLTANSRPSSPDGPVEGQKSSAPRFAASDYGQSNFPKLRGAPLIGANYTHYAFPNCTFHGTLILASYQQPGVAQRVHDQLLEMRKAGIATIRTLIWHTTKPEVSYGLSVPSAGGKLREPYRTNLIRYVSEIRRFGFARFTVSFGPEGTNNPLPLSYDPTKFRENWRFIEAVRSLVKRYGPADTRFDLFNEGAPNETPTTYEPRPEQTALYLRNMYRLYVKRFGNKDVSVSVIAGLHRAQRTNRLEYLIKTLKTSGVSMPRWYDVHIGNIPIRVSHALDETESFLDEYGQHQPIVIGDTAYDSPRMAMQFERFLPRFSHRVEEITPWYRQNRHQCPFTPPYKPGAYAQLRDYQ
jgi:hypothetical protein